VREVLPGVFHWPAIHPRIHIEVSSYWLQDGGILIDPLVPPDVGLQWFERRATLPAAILLSNRHHYRDSARFQDVFGCPVYCNRAGLGEFIHGELVTAFDPGDTLPGGSGAQEVGGLCPDETALHLPSKRAVVIADGVVRGSPVGRVGLDHGRRVSSDAERLRGPVVLTERVWATCTDVSLVPGGIDLAA